MSTFLNYNKRLVSLLIGLITVVVVPVSPLFAQNIERVSIDSNGNETNNNSSSPVISEDGRYIAFESDATNLVVGDTNTEADIFLHDTQTGNTTRVSVDSNGIQANAGSSFASISSDGRYIVFQSDATNLVAGDTNSTRDIFLHDAQTGDTTRISVDSNGGEANALSGAPQISSDGTLIVFNSYATNLVVGDTNNISDIFLHNTQTGDTTRVSVDSNGGEANNDSNSPDISSDGTSIVFHSLATNLVVGDGNASLDVFLHNTQTGDTTRISVDSNGAEANSDSFGAHIDSSGLSIVFQSDATNLVIGDTNTFVDVFLYEVQTGETTRVSVDSNGAQSNNDSFAAVDISADGHYIVFESQASNLDGQVSDTNNAYDIFRYDIQTGVMIRISVNINGIEGDDDSFRPSASIDGRYIVFYSESTNLVDSDTNNVRDIFLYDIQTNTINRVRTSVVTRLRDPALYNNLNANVDEYTCPYFDEYLRIHDKDVEQGGIKHQVSRLQQFLIRQGFNALMTIDGIFGLRTHNAVIAWQNHYAEEILWPWSLFKKDTANGYFYKASRRWANMQNGCIESIILDNGVTLPADPARLKVFY